MKKLIAVFGLALLLPVAASAVEPDEILADPALEARARGISRQLRCVVCQNQDIDSSNAGVARDLRLLVRERLEAGDTDEQVIAFVTARYGDFVLLKPPFKPETYVLWFAPPALALLALAAGAAVVAGNRKRRRQAALDPEDDARVARIIEDYKREPQS
ncbi:cytochrome c-type biogenesis protein [Tranquillimonas alkanivorans]|uniref:Cytochrome c-type biogenesis protein n=1 Tax=Tranquillimonas alkanivorans TaxID=441119 RepID=A0A1I5V684_9RHOB|nr:cytochrome c-type biogenesis protein [Tranquillimonas alkanivorans]SFQ02456.1 cytochrome c-type biogenesis protein CcmH [Tranquillimonas alkanivorans]